MKSQQIFSALAILFCSGSVACGYYSFRGPLRNTKPGDWVAHRLAWINDTNDVNSVLDLTDWIAGTANQVYVVDHLDGSLGLNLPQDINTTSSPNFQALTTIGTISAGADTDINNVFGRWIMGYEPTFGADAALLAHYDMFTPTDFALAQDNAGDTWLNSGHYTYLCSDGTYYARLYAAGGVTPTYHIISGVTLAIGGALGSERVEITQSGTDPTILDIATDYSNLLLNVNGTIASDKLQARTVAGLAVYEDSGVGIFIEDGGNVGLSTTNPTMVLDVNDDMLRIRTAKTPGSASATGDTGTIAWDAGYIYVCVATNTWKRTVLTTWTEHIIYAGENVIFATEQVVYP